MPKVAMNELMPTLTTKNALIAPITRPVARAATMPRNRVGIFAITTPDSTTVLATLRSSSPMMRTTVRPTATRPINATLLRVTP